MMRSLLLLALLSGGQALAAAVPAALLREAAESILRAGGKEAAETAVEQMGRRLGALATQHGDEALRFAKETGEAGVRALEEAGEQAGQVLALHTRHGSRAMYVIGDPRRLRLALQHGDAAATAMIRHPGIADDLIRTWGNDAAQALAGSSRASAQRLNQLLAREGAEAIADKPGLLAVCARYGERAIEFAWRHKVVLASAAVLAAFIADPEPFLAGTAVLADAVVTPLAKALDWTAIVLVVLVIVLLPGLVRRLRRGRRVGPA